MKKNIAILITSVIFSSCTLKEDKVGDIQKNTIDQEADSLLKDDKEKDLAIILKVADNKGHIAPLTGISLKNKYGDGRTDIRVSKDILISESGEIRNPKNALQQDELYISFEVIYKFYSQEVKEYNPNSKVSTDLHTTKWYLLDKSGKYQKVLTYLPKTKEFKLYFDGTTNTEAYLPSEIIDGSIVKERLYFKVFKGAAPIKLIYINAANNDGNQFFSFQL
ncbi:MAG: hypothetical protein V4546_16395 [Bacteroidota bacterium]